MTGIKIWDGFYQNNKTLKTFGKTVFDYSKPDGDIVELAKVFKKEKVKKILDLGCGSGRNCRFLSSKGFAVVGMDISKSAIKQAKKADGKIEYLVADMKKIPFPTDSFDALVSTQTIFHGRLQEIQQTINEIGRVVRNKGVIFITLQPVKGNKHRMGEKLEPNTYISNGGDDKGEIHHFFTKAEILKVFKELEFIDLHFVESNNYWYLLLRNKK